MNTVFYIRIYISVRLIKWPVTGRLWAPPALETAGAHINIQFRAGVGINQAHVYTEDKIKQICIPTLATTLWKCAPNNRSPLFCGPTSLLVLLKQLLHPSSAGVCRQGFLGGPLEESEGACVCVRVISHQEPHELVQKSESGTQRLLVDGTYLQFFSLPCISSGTVAWTQPSRSAMIHPGYGSSRLILSKDGSEAHGGQTLIPWLMTLIWVLRFGTLSCEAVEALTHRGWWTSAARSLRWTGSSALPTGIISDASLTTRGSFFPLSMLTNV